MIDWMIMLIKWNTQNDNNSDVWRSQSIWCYGLPNQTIYRIAHRKNYWKFENWSYSLAIPYSYERYKFCNFLFLSPIDSVLLFHQLLIAVLYVYVVRIGQSSSCCCSAHHYYYYSLSMLLLAFLRLFAILNTQTHTQLLMEIEA